MKLRELVDKVITKKGWYEQLKTSPEELSKTHNLNLTEQQIAALKKINYESLDDLAQAFAEKNT